MLLFQISRETDSADPKRYARPNGNFSNGTCGDYSFDYGSLTKTLQAVDTAGAMMHSAASFAEQCYVFNSTSTDILSPDCDAHGRQKIQWTVDDTVPCPF